MSPTGRLEARKAGRLSPPGRLEARAPESDPAALPRPSPTGPSPLGDRPVTGPLPPAGPSDLPGGGGTRCAAPR
ncbi:hypothetical protein [Streptomyces sp. SS]|uniref:hypothetical protein n=1 Tax=Streptomyces sp. SS TaxID=260742 RepID=UPI00037ED4EC|nr:hypothetical protein [Streptomyces sp. SS]